MRGSRRSAIGVAAALLALQPFSGPPLRAQPDPQGPAEAGGLVAQVLREENVPGAVVAVATATSTALLLAFGLADPAGTAPLTATTTLAVGPLSPLLVALTAARSTAVLEETTRQNEHIRCGPVHTLEEHDRAMAAQAAALAARVLPAGGAGPGFDPKVEPAVPYSIEPLAMLDQPIDAGALGIENPFAATAGLTVRHLLEQTAGLAELSPRDELPAAAANLPLTEVMRRAPHRLRLPPGLVRSPSAASITAAALQLERWTHASFAALAEAEVIRPLELSCTGFRPAPGLSLDRARGTRGGRAVDPQQPAHWPAQGLVSCGQDLAALLQLLAGRGRFEGGELHGQQLVGPERIDLLASGRSLQAPRGLVWGGAGGGALLVDGLWGAGLGGVQDGLSAQLDWFPLQAGGGGFGTAVVLTAESPRALARIAAILRRTRLRPNRPAGLASPAGAALQPPPAPGAAAQIERLAGHWRSLSPRYVVRAPFDDLLLELSVAPQGEGALVQGPGGAELVVPAGGGLYRRTDAVAPSWALVDRDGGEVLLGPDGAYRRSSAAFLSLRQGLALSALAALAAAALFSIVWLPRAVFGGLRGSPDLPLRALPALAGWVLAEWLLRWQSIASEGTQRLAEPNGTTLLLFALGPIWAALSVAGLVEAVRYRRTLAANRAGRPLWIFCGVASLLGVLLALLCGSSGLLFVRTWTL